MSNIKLKVKLSAYSKGIIPDVSKFIEDAPVDNKVYGRKNNEWVDIKADVLDQQIIIEKGSGLNIKHIEPNIDSLSVRQSVITNQKEIVDEDTTYYLIENTPDLYIVGGTAFLDEDGYNQKIIGGNASTTIFDETLLPINSEGKYNE